MGRFSVATGLSFCRKSVSRALDAARYGIGDDLVLRRSSRDRIAPDRETTNYRDNLSSGAPALWVALHAAASGQPYEILAVTADPAEGEAFTDAGSYLVEAVPMPSEVVETIAQFLAEHHVERPFVKRRREPAEPTLARREDENGRR